jgi:hypothetical protein
MSTIIAGSFDGVTEADAAVRRLQEAGVALDHICTFRVNPAGSHDKLPAGGDHDASTGSKHAQSGATKGAAVGAAVGAVAGAVGGPVGMAAGAGVGAYTGSLVGSLNEIDNEAQPGLAAVRPASNLVAVNADASGITEDAVARIFEDVGAIQIERALGRWEADAWADFDAARAPNVIGGTLSHVARNEENRPSV